MADIKIGNKTIHTGEHYGGAAQRVVNFVDSDDRLMRMKNSQNRLKEKQLPSDKMDKPRSLRGSLGKILLVDTERIQWVPVAGVRYFVIDSWMILQVIRDKRLAQNFWSHRRLYGDLAKEIRRLVKSRKIERRGHFVVKATGADPEYKSEFGTLIKLSVAGSEFVLPNSFPRDFREIILESHP